MPLIGRPAVGNLQRRERSGLGRRRLLGMGDRLVMLRRWRLRGALQLLGVLSLLVLQLLVFGLLVLGLLLVPGLLVPGLGVVRLLVLGLGVLRLLVLRLLVLRLVPGLRVLLWLELFVGGRLAGRLMVLLWRPHAGTHGCSGISSHRPLIINHHLMISLLAIAKHPHNGCKQHRCQNRDAKPKHDWIVYVRSGLYCVKGSKTEHYERQQMN